MPPAPFKYAPNQTHRASSLGPICIQRWPIELPASLVADSRAHLGRLAQVGPNENSSGDSWLEMQMNLMGRLVPKSLATHLASRMRSLSRLEQSEDCLNLNIYAPIEGKLRKAATCSAGLDAGPTKRPLPCWAPPTVGGHQ